MYDDILVRVKEKYGYECDSVNMSLSMICCNLVKYSKAISVLLCEKVCKSLGIRIVTILCVQVREYE